MAPTDDLTQCGPAQPGVLAEPRGAFGAVRVRSIEATMGTPGSWSAAVEPMVIDLR